MPITKSATYREFTANGAPTAYSVNTDGSVAMAMPDAGANTAALIVNPNPEPLMVRFGDATIRAFPGAGGEWTVPASSFLLFASDDAETANVLAAGYAAMRMSGSGSATITLGSTSLVTLYQ